MRGKSMMKKFEEKLREMGADGMMINAQEKWKEIGVNEMMHNLQDKLKEMGANKMMNNLQHKLKGLNLQEKMKGLLFAVDNSGGGGYLDGTVSPPPPLEETGGKQFRYGGGYLEGTVSSPPPPEETGGKQFGYCGGYLHGTVSPPPPPEETGGKQFGYGDGYLIGAVSPPPPPPQEETGGKQFGYGAPFLITPLLVLFLLCFWLCNHHCCRRRIRKMMKALGRNHKIPGMSLRVTPKHIFAISTQKRKNGRFIMTQRNRAKNMTPIEDYALCRSYVKILCDEMNGASQPGDIFWDKITEHYHTHPEITTLRRFDSLQKRFSYISTHVMLFVSKLAHWYAFSGESGTNELDWVNRARDDYQSENKNKPFIFDSCYQILKELPKYDFRTTLPYTQLSQPNPIGSHTTSASPSADSPIDNESPLEGPIGRNAAKAVRKRKAKLDNIAVNTQVLEKVGNFFNAYVESIPDARAASDRFESRMERIVVAKEQKTLDALLMMDTTYFNPEQKEYHKLRMKAALQQQRQNMASHSVSSDASI